MQYIFKVNLFGDTHVDTVFSNQVELEIDLTPQKARHALFLGVRE
jgi:hypothetical protein